MTVRGVLPARRPSVEAPRPAKPRAIFETVRWGSRGVRLVSHDEGKTYLGGTAEAGLLLVVRRGCDAVDPNLTQWVARIEDRENSRSWPGAPRPRIDSAVASLQREIKRLSRAAELRVI